MDHNFQLQLQQPMIHIEELPPEKYEDHKFETLVKQLTAKESTKRHMRQETEICQNKAIVGYNTNNSSLDGAEITPTSHHKQQSNSNSFASLYKQLSCFQPPAAS
jgi:hypothetical protein